MAQQYRSMIWSSRGGNGGARYKLRLSPCTVCGKTIWTDLPQLYIKDKKLLSLALPIYYLELVFWVIETNVAINENHLKLKKTFAELWPFQSSRHLRLAVWGRWRPEREWSRSSELQPRVWNDEQEEGDVWINRKQGCCTNSNTAGQYVCYCACHQGKPLLFCVVIIVMDVCSAFVSDGCCCDCF